MQARFKRDILKGIEFDPLMPPPSGVNRLVENEVDASGTVTFMMRQIRLTLTQTAKIAQELKKDKLADTCRAIWNFLYWHIQYTTDTAGVEEIETPSYIWSQRETDCDGYAVFASSILSNLDIAHKIRVTAYESGWQHVYVVVPKDGDPKKTLDRKKNRDAYIVIDPVADKYDYEAPYTDNFDTVVERARIKTATLGSLTPDVQIKLPPGIVRHTKDVATGKLYGWDAIGVMYELTVEL